MSSGDRKAEFYGRRKYMPEYHAWGELKSRCTNKNYPSYKDYGARGIKVCDEWLNDFPAFYHHIGPKPQPYKDYSLDRIDNDRGYEPGNVRWATRYQQQKNRRLHKDNKSGASGITWSDKKNGWSVMDYRDDICHYIGFYPLLGKAIDALVEYRVQLELAQEAKQAMLRQRAFDQKLIDKEANKARLDELKALQTKWYQYANGKMSPKPNPNEDWLGADIYDRIAQLTTDKEKA